MADKNKIEVELRLLLDKLREDVRRASSVMKAGLANPAKDVATETDKASASMEKLEQKTKRTTSALNEQLSAWKARKAELEAQARISISGAQQAASQSPGGWMPGQTVRVTGGGLATPPGLPQPSIAEMNGPYRGYGMASLQARGFMGNPKLPAGGAPTFPQATPLTGSLSSPLTIAAQLGAALAGLRVAFGLVRWAAEAAAAPLRELARNAERANRATVNATLSGRPIGLQTQMQEIGSVLGVSEKDAILFSMAIRGLDDRMKTTINTLTNAAPELFAFHVEVKAAAAAFRAFVVEAMNPLVGPLRDFVASFRTLFSVMQNSYITKALGEIAGGLLRAITIWTQFVNTMIASLHLLVNAAADIIAFGINNLVNLVKGKKPMGYDQMFSAETKQMFDDIFKRRDDISASPVSSVQRMASSAWEKMGLVVGAGRGDFQRQIAQATKEAAASLKRIEGSLVPRGAGGSMQYSFANAD